MRTETSGTPFIASAMSFGRLAARIFAEEHRLYPEAIRIVLAGGSQVVDRRFVRSARDQAGAPQRRHNDDSRGPRFAMSRFDASVVVKWFVPEIHSQNCRA